MRSYRFIDDGEPWIRLIRNTKAVRSVISLDQRFGNAQVVVRIKVKLSYIDY